MKHETLKEIPKPLQKEVESYLKSCKDLNIAKDALFNFIKKNNKKAICKVEVTDKGNCKIIAYVYPPKSEGMPHEVTPHREVTRTLREVECGKPVKLPVRLEKNLDATISRLKKEDPTITFSAHNYIEVVKKPKKVKDNESIESLTKRLNAVKE